MRAMLSRSLNFEIPDAEDERWQPYIPGIFRMREVAKQVGHRPALYVMRLHDGKRWIYRECSASELSVIKVRDVDSIKTDNRWINDANEF